MYKKLLLAALVSGAFGLTGCASDGASDAGAVAAGGAGAADVFGKAIYLRGELTEPQWAPLDEYLIQPVADNVWKAKAELKVDWAPYKFKFADSAWTPGTNFGYASDSAPGVFEWGGNPIVLNPSSKFEEVNVTPPADGVFDFFIEKQGDKFVTYVKEPQ